MRKNDPIHPTLWNAVLAANERVNALLLDLQNPDYQEIAMAVPAIAFDQHDIVWGEACINFGKKSVIEFPVSELTHGRFKKAQPGKLCELLFNERVGERVNTLLSLAMVWSHLDDIDGRAEVGRLSYEVRALVLADIAQSLGSEPPV